jgi:hypothetical protein
MFGAIASLVAAPLAAIGTAAAAAPIIGGILGRNEQKSAADAAAAAEIAGTNNSIAEQRRQFDIVQEILRPYVQSGVGALAGQESLIGLRGADGQAAAIEALRGSPEYAALLREGENAILQNASATGGLRGGNVQSALARFRPALLSDLINKQYERLGGLTSLGQASATGQAAAAQQTGANVSALFQNQGQAAAKAALAKGQASANMYGNLAGLGSTLGTLAFSKALGF